MARFRVVGSLVLALTALVAITGCGSGKRASGFCARVEHGSPAFNSLDAAHQKAALAAFDQVADTAPPAIAADFHTVSAFRREIGDKPGWVTANRLAAYASATKRIDAYLHDTCGIDIPPPAKLF